MKGSYHTLSTQMSVILKDSFRRKDLFDLFGLKHNPSDTSTMEEVCNAHGIDPMLFLHLCNIYTFEDYQLEDNITGGFPLEPAIDYVIKAHDYFKQIIMVQVRNDFNEINSIRNDRVLAELFTAALETMDEHILNCHNVFTYYRDQHQPVTHQQIKQVMDFEVRAYRGIEVLIKYMMNMQSSETYKTKADYLKYFLIFLRKDFDKNGMVIKAIFKRITDN